MGTNDEIIERIKTIQRAQAHSLAILTVEVSEIRAIMETILNIHIRQLVSQGHTEAEVTAEIQGDFKRILDLGFDRLEKRLKRLAPDQELPIQEIKGIQ